MSMSLGLKMLFLDLVTIGWLLVDDGVLSLGGLTVTIVSRIEAE